MRRALLAVFVVLLASGCSGEKKNFLLPALLEIHVTGTLVEIHDGRGADGAALLTLEKAAGDRELVYAVGVSRGIEPTPQRIALDKQLDALELEDRLTASGRSRVADGWLIVEVIENHGSVEVFP